MMNFLRSNWFSIVSVIFALIALIVALQANAYSKEANEIARQGNQIAIESSSAQVLLRDNGTTRAMIPVFTCFNSQTLQYHVYRSLSDLLVFTNNGGRATSLMNVELREKDVNEGEVQYSIEIFRRGIEKFRDERPLLLPLLIDAGIGEIWIFEGQHHGWYENREYAVKLATDLKNRTQQITWTFEFSDGGIITKTYEESWHSVSSVDYAQECSS